MQELRGSILNKFGIAICRKCVVEYRRTTDLQHKIEALAKKHIEEVQEKLRSDIYILTKSLQWKE